jgi:hypothetical protein
MGAAGAKASTSLASTSLGGPDRAAVQGFESYYRSGSRGLTHDGYRSKAGAGVTPLKTAALGRHVDGCDGWDAMSTVATVSPDIKIGNTEEAAASWNVGIDEVRGWWDHMLTLPKIDEIRQHNLILDLNSVGGQNATSKLILLLKVKRALADSYGAGDAKVRQRSHCFCRCCVSVRKKGVLLAHLTSPRACATPTRQKKTQRRSRRAPTPRAAGEDWFFFCEVRWGV